MQYGTRAQRERVFSMIPVKARSRSSRERSDFLADSFGSEILDEKSFARMLCLERKRTERSGRRFVLMLLQGWEVGRAPDGNDALERALRTLLDSTRETDVKGWYKNGTTIGVIFAEIGSTDGKLVARALLDRVTTALCNTLTIDEINGIRMSFHVFPDELAEQGHDGPPDLTLYPDQTSGPEERRGSRLVKRGIDILGSGLGLIVLAPLFLVIAAAIRLTSRGPVLFRQQRVGRFGTRFTFLKFRSMYVSNDETVHKKYVTTLISGRAQADAAQSGERKVFKIRNDPRVTPVGKFLRRSSLDELPQLINVLRGDMSLVGPRPPIPYEYACYNTWHRRRLLTVKPGITGLWQVKGRSRVSFDEMVRLDLQYAATWSMLLDIKILFMTPAAVLSGEGAY
jgi:lipopolysaccharide/colanic/teichoic acid biosynthesis glycosyltransferase